MDGLAQVMRFIYIGHGPGALNEKKTRENKIDLDLRI